MISLQEYQMVLHQESIPGECHLRISAEAWNSSNVALSNDCAGQQSN